MQIHHLDGYIQSIYLVEYEHGLLLLDGCCRADIETLQQFIENELGRCMGDLKLVVVTHMHPDHAGAAQYLRKRFGCKIASANKQHQWYRGVVGMIMHLTDIVLASWVASRLGKQRRNLWYPASLQPDYVVNDGDALPVFEQWQVIETPGHTDRDLSLLHVETKRIYVADLIVKVKKRFIPPFPVFHPNKYHNSIGRLMEIRPKSVMLAHGGEVQLLESDYQFLFDRAPEVPKTHWRATKGKFRQALQRYKRN